MTGGMVVGVISLVWMAEASSIVLLGVGWVLAQRGWGTVLSTLQISSADRLPESECGSVGGLTGFAAQIAAVFGVILAQFFTGDALLLCLRPGRGRPPRSQFRSSCDG